MKTHKTESIQEPALLLLCILAFGFSLWAIHVGWQNSITNSYSFRQSQTAIAARSIQEGGPFFAYETPVLGPPWALPFEFPFYQGLVGWSARILQLPLEQTGRLLSALFFYATLWPAWCCLAFLGLQKFERSIVLALIALSPFYIFWSRAFMIESTVMFFSVTYLAMVFRALSKGRGRLSPWLLITIALIGGLAGVIKITTYTSFLLAATFAILWDWWNQRRSANKVTTPVLLIVACVVPFLLTMAWTHYADAMKSKSPMSAWLTSKALVTWNFGTVQQRFQLSNYSHFGPVINSIIGNKVVFALIFVGMLFVPKRRQHVAGCLALWTSNILIFFNLHYVHSYYAYANGIFLVVALGFVIVGLYERGGEWRWATGYLLAFCMGALISRYFIDFYTLQRINFSGIRAVAQVLDRTTQPEDVLLIYGLDWSSELPYLAHRHAIMDRYDFAPDPGLQFALSHLPPRRLGSVVVCGSTRSYPQSVHNLLLSLSFETTVYTNVSECEIYLPWK